MSDATETSAGTPPDLAAMRAEACRTLAAAVAEGQSRCTCRECRHAHVVLALVAECERRAAERDELARDLGRERSFNDRLRDEATGVISGWDDAIRMLRDAAEKLLRRPGPAEAAEREESPK